MTLSNGLLLIAILAFSSLAASIIKGQQSTLAQSFIKITKDRNLVIDLGNGVKTNAQLTIAALGKGPYPGVLLIPGSGAVDMNETVAKNVKPFWQVTQYLTERGFVVLRYDKRGIGTDGRIINLNLWGNTTVNDLIHDAEKAFDVLIRQPEVDPKMISIIGHSEGAIIGPRVAIDNQMKVKNIVLMGAVAQDFPGLAQFQYIGLPIEYTTQVLDKNHTGSINIQQTIKDPLYGRSIAFALANNKSYSSTTTSATSHHQLENNSNSTTSRQAVAIDAAGYISIDKQLKGLLEKVFQNFFENLTGGTHSKCKDPREGCPIYFKSEVNLEPNLSVIGNVSSSTGILILNGENDTQTPVQQALLLQQRLTELNHPDHTLITYPNLGHLFFPSSQWKTGLGPIQQYVLADLFAWLSYHNGNIAVHYHLPVNTNITTSPYSNSASHS